MILNVLLWFQLYASAIHDTFIFHTRVFLNKRGAVGARIFQKT